MQPPDSQRNAAFTHQGNIGAVRHGWLRLTPAYGVRLVQTELAAHPDARRVLDPFSGSGTTGVCAAADGRYCDLIDINPFLVWLARAKTRSYPAVALADAAHQAVTAAEHARGVWTDPLWEPPIHNISRWWSPSARAALRALRAGLDAAKQSGGALDLLLVAFCQMVIDASSAAFNHVSMSFRDVVHDHQLPQADQVLALIDDFERRAALLLADARCVLPGTVRVQRGDARTLAACSAPADLLLTSPPYCNRMSYIRELRPYMYWLRFLQDSGDAGELDWQAIAGTWGVATSRLSAYRPVALPAAGAGLVDVVERIAAAPAPNAGLLARYVSRYVADVWAHTRSAYGALRPGGRAVYVVGNSTFFGVQVPTQEYYAALLTAAGFTGVQVERLRKRNSNKALYEYVVRAVR